MVSDDENFSEGRSRKTDVDPNKQIIKIHPTKPKRIYEKVYKSGGRET